MDYVHKYIPNFKVHTTRQNTTSIVSAISVTYALHFNDTCLLECVKKLFYDRDASIVANRIILSTLWSQDEVYYTLNDYIRVHLICPHCQELRRSNDHCATCRKSDTLDEISERWRIRTKIQSSKRWKYHCFQFLNCRCSFCY